MTPKNQNKIIIGCLGSAFGVRGQLKVNSYTSPTSNILNYPVWQIQHNGQWHIVQIEKVTMKDTNIILKIKGIDDRDSAKTYTNDLLAIERDELPDTEQDEYYWADLVGMTVITTSGIVLGQIAEMRETGANDVMVIQGDTKRHLVPFIDQFLVSTDPIKREIIVDWDHEF